MGQIGGKTTEIYTYVSEKSLQKNKVAIWRRQCLKKEKTIKPEVVSLPANYSLINVQQIYYLLHVSYLAEYLNYNYLTTIYDEFC
jgi:hypothetical protein